MSRPPRAFDALGPVIRDLRIERGLTQVELAARAGVSKSMLSLYEGGKRRPQLETLERLVDALGVRLGELAMRLESWPRREKADPSRRGPKRISSEASCSGTLHQEAVAAATEVLRRIAILLQHAVQGERGRIESAVEPAPNNDDAEPSG